MSTPEISPAKTVLLGAQTLFIAFGALVLVPILTGLDPSVALFTAGLGTLIFQAVTKRSVPVFLGSSFAFIAPIIFGVQKWGVAATLSGLFAAGIVYLLLSLLVRTRGPEKIHSLLPPTVTGPVIILIGLILAPVAVNLALGKTGDGGHTLHPEKTATLISMITLLCAGSILIFTKGLIRLIPVLISIAAGYVLSLFFGIVDFTAVRDAPWFQIPQFTKPTWSWDAVLFIVPVAIVPAIEHVGDILAVGSLTKKNYIKKPGLHRTLLGDGLATLTAALFGGPPNTTYSEVTGSLALTRVFSVKVMSLAAVFAILLSFIGKVGAFLQSIPSPVMGGVLILLFGTIVTVGLNTIVQARVDLMERRNLLIVSIILIFGVGGMSFSTGDFVLKGIGLAAIVGILLNLVLPKQTAQ